MSVGQAWDTLALATSTCVLVVTHIRFSICSRTFFCAVLPESAVMLVLPCVLQLLPHVIDL